MTAGNWRPHDTDFMRAAAALLICNSHLKQIYPHTWLAGDGLIGNSLFFFLSGFGIALSGKSLRLGFFKWYLRRVNRIYPACTLCTIFFVFIFGGQWRYAHPLDYLSTFVWPTPYFYVTIIMIIYMPIYLVGRIRSATLNLLVLGALLVGYVVATVNSAGQLAPRQPLVLGELGWVHIAYFSFVALLGTVLAPITGRPLNALPRDIAAFFAIFVVYFAVKFEMDHGHGARYFFLLHVFAVILSLFILRISASDELHALFSRLKYVGAAVAVLAGLTLEIYVVQGFIWPRLGTVTWPWPVRLLAFWTITLTGAVVLQKLTALVMHAFQRQKPFERKSGFGQVSQA